MSVEWNDSTLDDILSDVRRMEQERAQADVSAPISAETVVRNSWTMADIDRLLGVEEDALAGISDYAEPEPLSQEAPVLLQQDAEGQAEFTVPDQPPVRREKRESSRMQKLRRRYAPLPGQEDASSIQPEPEPELGQAAPAAAEQPPQDEASASGELPTQRVPELPVIETSDEAAGEEATRRIPDLRKADKDLREGRTKIIGRLPHHGKKQKNAPKPETDPEMVDGQMMLQGFVTEEPAEQVDEAQAAQELGERRKEQVKDFKLLDFAKKYEPDLPPKDDLFEEPEPSDALDGAEPALDMREYRSLGERMRVGKRLQEERRNTFFSVCALTLLEIVLIVLSSIASAGTGEKQVLYAVSLVLLAFAAALSISDLIGGVKALLRWKPTCDSAAAITTAFAFIQGAVAFVLYKEAAIPSTFCAAAAGVLLLSKTAKLFEALGVLSNFKFAAFTAAERLYEIRGFAEKSDAFEVGKSLQVGDAKLRYSHPTRFPSGFIRRSVFRTSVDRLCKILIPAAFGLSLVTALFGYINSKSALGALSAFSCALCVAMPAGAAVTIAIPAVLLMRSLNRRGGMIVSPEAASAGSAIHGVAMDAVDLYDRKETVIDCYKDYHAIRFDDMFLYAAALVIGAHSPLEGAFMEMVGNVDILPPVKNLICEERLGICGYIHDQSVLLGSRNLLVNHSIDPPPKTVEVRYIQEGKRVLYLAVGNKIAAMFVINYVENDDLAPPLQTLQNNEISLVVYAPDCNVTEEFLAEGFGLSNGSAKLMSPAAGKILRERSAETTESAPAELMHDGRPESLLRTLADAAVIHNIQRVAAFIAVIGSFIGWLVSFVILLTTREITTMNWIFATIYPALWIVLSTVLGVLQERKAAK